MFSNTKARGDLLQEVCKNVYTKWIIFLYNDFSYNWKKKKESFCCKSKNGPCANNDNFIIPLQKVDFAQKLGNINEIKSKMAKSI